MANLVYPYIVIVDDDDDISNSVALLLRRSGLEPVCMLSDGRQLMNRIAIDGASVILLDLNMPFIKGEVLLTELVSHHPEIPVIVMTAVNDLETAVECMKRGANDYLLKPLEEGKLLAAVRNAQEVFALRTELNNLKGYLLGQELRRPEAFAHILTRSSHMVAIFKYMEAISLSKEPLLILGETGTGKELFAKAFHHLRGTEGPFVPVNVAGLDDHMFADTLFGHRKGAFTGADQSREGLVARAAGGILFLDELGDLSESSQVKLLRLLQERKYEPLGSDLSRNADITVVAATNRDLKQRLRDGKFRLDLYYRLATHAIHLPPLRDRHDDLPLLLNHFVEEAARQLGKPLPTLPTEVLSLLKARPFPGNVRELRAMAFDAVARHDKGVMPVRLFREDPDGPGPTAAVDVGERPLMTWPEGDSPPTLQAAEEFLIAHAMEKSGGNQGVAATMLGLSRQALNQRLQRRQNRPR
ncbi:MAG: sigma-54-dependent Fis family transcriptional regulator [Magnetococcales bacterium]|nr:sigma-54-dependent Fis family transcriptional regulator [Magnetococcales bacterium]